MVRERLLFGAACALVCALGPVSAVADVTRPDGKTIDCYCTDSKGGRIEMGETICLSVNGRMFTAQCQMSLNNPMWREVSEGCMTSALPSDTQTSPLGQSLKPPVDAG